jgi:nicotinamide-nucleotide amidase
VTGSGLSAPGVELVTIGEELLSGETVDGNAAWLGRELRAAGVRVLRRTTVGDDAAAIRSVVAECLRRVDVVICTGGLGPTRDDITLDAVAGLTGRPLAEDADVLRNLEERFARLGREMPAINRRQARVPDGADVFPNPLGTAPGMAVPAPGDHAVILLPGVPAEMRAITAGSVLPWLAQRWPAARGPGIRLIRTTGIAESAAAERVDDLVAAAAPVEVAFLPGTDGVDLRLTSWGAADLASLHAALAARLDRWVYAVSETTLEAVVAGEMIESGLRLAVAESCTGGLVAKRLTDLPGSSGFFLGSWVAYADSFKRHELGVSPELLAAHGAVSRETALALAAGARRSSGADAALAVTGIAGPAGGSPDKPVGTVWLAVETAAGAESRALRLPGDRGEVRERAAQAALHLLLLHLRRRGGHRGRQD